LICQKHNDNEEAESSKEVYREGTKINKYLIDMSWSKWLEERVKMSASYADCCILKYKMVKKYPKLSQLKITFTELFSMKKISEDSSLSR